MRRDEILQASAHIFRRKGFNGTSMQDIADAVQLQKASLYHHIDSKQEILLALLDQAMDTLIAQLERVIRAQATATIKLRRATASYVNRLTEHGDLAAVLLLEYRSLEPELLSRHILKRDRFEAIWRQIIEEGIESGEFRPLDPRLVGFALLGALNWIITWFDPAGELDSGAVADRFLDLFLDGLKQEPSESDA